MARSQADPSFVLTFFKEQISSNNAQRRLFSASCLPHVAAAIGPEHTRVELVNYLKTTGNIEAEVQMTLAAQLGKLIKYVGGNEHLHVLLDPIKVFASADEIIVRDKAIESMAEIVEAFPANNADTYLMDATQELANSPLFTARSSACAFIILVYPSVNETNKSTLRGAFKKLAQDETPMVRRAALKQLPGLCDQLPPVILVQEFARDVLVNSAADDEDSVRLLLPASFAIISNKLEDAERSQLIVYLCKLVVKDGSWKVRSSLAQSLPDIAAPFPPEQVASEISPLLFRLLKDPEAETKTVACQALSRILPSLKEQQAFVDEKVIPEVLQLTRDISPQVRREASLHLMELAPILGSSITNEKLIPIMTQVLHDNENEASVALLTGVVNHVNELDLPSMTPLMLPVLVETAGDAHWRVKMVIIRLIPPLAKAVGLDEFNAKLYPLVTDWLESQFAAVREAMAKELGNLVEIFGQQWGSNVLAPQLLKYAKHQSFIMRQICLFGIIQLKSVFQLPALAKLFLPTVLELEKDLVANVRIMVAKTLIVFSGLNDSKVDASLKRLASDPDSDVSETAKSK